MKIIGYAAGYPDAVSLQRELLHEYGVESSHIYTDKLNDNRDDRRALNTLLGTPETLPYITEGDLLVIPETASLARNFAYTEMKWQRLMALKVRIIVLPLPIRFYCDGNSFDLDQVPYILAEFLKRKLYHDGAAPDAEATATQDRRASGRPCIPYPENWDKIYHAWKHRQISSADAIKKTGLTRTTFYNKVKAYEQESLTTSE